MRPLESGTWIFGTATLAAYALAATSKNGATKSLLYNIAAGTGVSAITMYLFSLSEKQREATAVARPPIGVPIVIGPPPAATLPVPTDPLMTDPLMMVLTKDPLRAAPGASVATSGPLNVGEVVRVIGAVPGYYLVSRGDGTRGYLPASQLGPRTAAPPTPPTPAGPAPPPTAPPTAPPAAPPPPSGTPSSVQSLPDRPPASARESTTQTAVKATLEKGRLNVFAVGEPGLVDAASLARGAGLSTTAQEIERMARLVREAVPNTLEKVEYARAAASTLQAFPSRLPDPLRQRKDEILASNTVTREVVLRLITGIELAFPGQFQADLLPLRQLLARLPETAQQNT